MKLPAIRVLASPKLSLFTARLNTLKISYGDQCWLWDGELDKRGYGRFYAGKIDGNYRKVFAHRMAYELLIGPIPEDKVIDHLCRNPKCVNPHHMEPVQQKTNWLRGEHHTAIIIRTNTCANGHNLSEFGVTRKNGSRRCRICYNAWMRDYRKRKLPDFTLKLDS